jgi:hypothetical protein
MDDCERVVWFFLFIFIYIYVDVVVVGKIFQKVLRRDKQNNREELELNSLMMHR